MKVPNPNHWTARESPNFILIACSDLRSSCCLFYTDALLQAILNIAFRIMSLHREYDLDILLLKTPSISPHHLQDKVQTLSGHIRSLTLLEVVSVTLKYYLDGIRLSLAFGPMDLFIPL